MALSIRNAYVLVDWDTARRCAWLTPTQRRRVELGGPSAQLSAVVSAIANCLSKLRKERLRVEVRIYHGWRRGNELTADHQSLAGLPERRSAFSNNRILVAPPILSETLACGGRYQELRDTLRRRENGDLEQKMVDTAIAADLLYLARKRTGKNDADFIVLSEDDDMIPPVVVANEWGVSCKILRRRGPNRCMPLTRELLVDYS